VGVWEMGGWGILAIHDPRSMLMPSLSDFAI
jgi:hypothetical protein